MQGGEQRGSERGWELKSWAELEGWSVGLHIGSGSTY